jgi:hypothetical protein
MKKLLDYTLSKSLVNKSFAISVLVAVFVNLPNFLFSKSPIIFGTFTIVGVYAVLSVLAVCGIWATTNAICRRSPNIAFEQLTIKNSA